MTKFDLIGNTWLNCKDSAGNRRLDNQDDFVRKEISLAISRKIKIIPVLLENAQMPDANELPDDIKQVCKWQAISITDSRWKFDVERLIKSINLRKKLFVFNHKLLLPLLFVLVAAITFGIWKRSSNENTDPSTPKDFYRNAKMFELSGDFASAQKAYKQYLKLNLPYIDPHISYQSMLKSQ